MRKEIDLPSGPWHRQPLRYTQFMVHAFKTESVNRYYILLYIPNPNLTHPIVQVSVNYLNKLVQPILSLKIIQSGLELDITFDYLTTAVSLGLD